VIGTVTRENSFCSGIFILKSEFIAIPVTNAIEEHFFCGWILYKEENLL
jgi:hypothetical protein